MVTQLRFARTEFMRCLEGVFAEDASRRLLPMNCISWIVGHLAYQEHLYWVVRAQGRDLAPDLEHQVGWGQPASTPPLDGMWYTYHTVTDAADTYLDSFVRSSTWTTERLQTHQKWEGEHLDESIGTKLLRNIYHYWFHTGEAHAIRQLLGHTDLPEFVGDISRAVYRPEA